MLISKNWLRDFVFLPDAFDAADLAQRLSLATVEVEGVVAQGADLENIVVGLITKVDAHPNADKLRVCTVDIGGETLSIVCGGSNVAVNMRVAVAKLGARVRWHGQGEPIVMEPATIRGVESRGMICAADEIGLAERFPKKDEKEIVDLSVIAAKPGTPLATALGLDDVIFDIDNKSLSNRPDLWGHYGLAREVAALTRKKFKELKPAALKTQRDWTVRVEVRASELCSRYMAVALAGVSASASPEWLVSRLNAAGQRSINAIVDLTNYVMLELGQPLHAFDADVIKEGEKAVSLIVRRATAGEHLAALDDKEYELNENALVIANQNEALALAGIKGGKHSGVSETTSTIIIEAATFSAGLIRRTSTQIGLRTDSSARFEKTLDPALPEFAIRRIVELARQIWPKVHVVSDVADVTNFNTATKVLEFPWNFINERLGVEIPRKTAVDILERLGFEVKIKKNQARVTVPTWRASKDISIPEDIVEEVARVYGYANIPGTMPEFPIVPPPANPVRQAEWTSRRALSAFAFTEVSNYSFVASEWLHRLGLKVDQYLALDNPIAKDRPLLRRELWPGILENVEANAHRFDQVRVFELGRSYCLEDAGERAEPRSDELLPRQPNLLGLAVAEKGNSEPFFAAAQAVRELGVALHRPLELRTATLGAQFHPGRSAEIFCAGVRVGWVAELHPQLQSTLGIASRVALAEFSLTLLIEQTTQAPTYTPVAEFPSVTRDIAFTVPQTTAHAALVAALQTADTLVKDVTLFDVYRGEHVAAGQKSVAYKITYQADHTLTTAEIEAAHKAVTKVLQKNFNAALRV